MTWKIKPLSGKYYGTEIEGDNGDSICIWTPFSTPVSTRELEGGWDEEYGIDHCESQKDYEYALVICEALNKMEKNK
jgi:hypothetical protein